MAADAGGTGAVPSAIQETRTTQRSSLHAAVRRNNFRIAPRTPSRIGPNRASLKALVDLLLRLWDATPNPHSFALPKEPRLCQNLKDGGLSSHCFKKKEPQNMKANHILLAAGLLALLFTRTVRAADPQYLIIDLGTLPGGNESSGADINNSGQVTGYSTIAGGISHAFLFSDGSMQDLGTLSGPNGSSGFGINDAGEVAGWSNLDSGDPNLAFGGTHAFLYSGGSMIDLGELPGGIDTSNNSSEAFAINNSGQVTGYSSFSYLNGSGIHAFLFSAGSMIDLGSLDSSNTTYLSFGNAINDSGQVAGRSMGPGLAGFHAFLYSGGTMSDLGTFGGAQTQSFNSYGNGINNSGQVTGWSDTPAGGAGGTYYRHAFLYSGGQLADLGTLTGDTFSLGNAINNAGQVVGSSGTFTSAEHAFLYSNGTMFDLNDLATNLAFTGLTLTSAYGVNDNGWIVGYGAIDNTRHAFLAKPAPPAQALNISTRLNVQTGDNVLIGGFIITGSNPKKVIVRAIGPSLGMAGVLDFLADPVLELHEPDGTIVTNDNWMDTQKDEIIASTFPPANDLESAIVATLAPGPYTAIVSGKNSGTGVGLVEAYDLDQTADAILANISTRGFVGTGDNVMIGGFIVGGGTGGSSTVVVRAIGPSLTPAGVANPLQDPVLELHDSEGAIIASNDNWMDSPDHQLIIDSGLAPANDKESALLATLAPGAYTAIVGGINNDTGVGLVEAYTLQ